MIRLPGSFTLPLSLLLTAALVGCASTAQTPEPTPAPAPQAETQPAPVETPPAAPAPREEPMATAPSDDSYQVMPGDHLWGISGKSSVYADSYRWPLIYKANTDKIQDADLIYPGQVLTISRGSTQAEIDAAVHHARTRGAWTLGAVEDTDRDYLAGRRYAGR